MTATMSELAMLEQRVSDNCSDPLQRWAIQEIRRLRKDIEAVDHRRLMEHAQLTDDLSAARADLAQCTRAHNAAVLREERLRKALEDARMRIEDSAVIGEGTINSQAVIRTLTEIDAALAAPGDGE